MIFVPPHIENQSLSSCTCTCQYHPCRLTRSKFLLCAGHLLCGKRDFSYCHRIGNDRVDENPKNYGDGTSWSATISWRKEKQKMDHLKSVVKETLEVPLFQSLWSHEKQGKSVESPDTKYQLHQEWSSVEFKGFELMATLIQAQNHITEKSRMIGSHGGKSSERKGMREKE